MKRAATFNPEGALSGARAMTFAGSIGYVLTPRGLVVLDLDKPAEPRLLGRVESGLKAPLAAAVQLRYLFVVDEEGLKVLDASDLKEPKAISGGVLALPGARSLYLARTYAYVAAGAKGVAVVDIEKPEQPRLDQWIDGGGTIDDAHDVKIGFTNGSGFAYVADGRNGLRVVQIISANDTPGAYGFSPRPTPKLVATYATHGPALVLSRGLDRDRAVDETGNQLAVFGRRGARPFNREELQRLLAVAPQADPKR